MPTKEERAAAKVAREAAKVEKARVLAEEKAAKEKAVADAKALAEADALAIKEAGEKVERLEGESKSAFKRRVIMAEQEVRDAIKAREEKEVVVPEVPVVPVAGVVVPPAKDYSHIVFEGDKVLKILETKHTPTHFHCQMSGGITKHVPKELFE